LGFQPSENIRMEMDRSVVLSHIQGFEVWIGLSQIGIEGGQLLDGNPTTLTRGHLACTGIQSSDHSAVRIGTVAQAGQMLRIAAYFVGPG